MITLQDFLLLKAEEQHLYFERGAAELKLPVNLVEKDFWGTILLEQVFSLSEVGPALTFKGGTSLSKVFGLIKRFSEDIDLSIDKTFFGFEGDRLPEHAPSRKKRNALLDELRLACQSYVQGRLLESLNNSLSTLLGPANNWPMVIDEEDPDKQSLLFHYPCITSGQSVYIKPAVKLELGARAEHWPVENHKISSYIHTVLSDVLSPWNCSVKVQSPVRTFWEKATILHMFANYPQSKLVPSRQSRHYADFFSLLKSPIKERALTDLSLLNDVCSHKAVYFESAWANYEEAKQGNLKLIPADEVLDQIRVDYRAMREMFFEEPADWALMIEEISKFEAELKNKREALL